MVLATTTSHTTALGKLAAVSKLLGICGVIGSIVTFVAMFQARRDNLRTLHLEAVGSGGLMTRRKFARRQMELENGTSADAVPEDGKRDAGSAAESTSFEIDDDDDAKGDRHGWHGRAECCDRR